MNRRTLIGALLLALALVLAWLVLFGFELLDDEEGPRPGEPPTESGQVVLLAQAR